MAGQCIRGFRQCLKTYVGSFDRRETFTMDYRLRRHDGERFSITAFSIKATKFLRIYRLLRRHLERRQAEEFFEI
jgi:hypothetical protein